MAKQPKPAKPYPDFPLFAHATGRWAKKIRGKFHYFGSWDDGWEAALARYDAEKVDLYAGRVPRRGPGVTVSEVCNEFFHAKKMQHEDGELRLRTLRDLRQVCEAIVESMGRTTPVASLTPKDFRELRDHLRTGSPEALAVRITKAKSVFNWAVHEEMLERPPKMGRSFEPPSRKVIRDAVAARGPLEFTAAEIRSLIAAAKGVQLPAMILLGINCGLGNRDCSELDRRHIDLVGGWLDFPRTKTGTTRRAKLWPETVAALRTAIAGRPKSKSKATANRVFLTRCGLEWCREHEKYADDAIAKAFRKLCGQCGAHKKGRGFYTLRRTYLTIADESCDTAAIDLTMGHVAESMRDRYRQRISAARLEAVAETVRRWLFN